MLYLRIHIPTPCARRALDSPTIVHKSPGLPKPAYNIWGVPLAPPFHAFPVMTALGMALSGALQRLFAQRIGEHGCNIGYDFEKAPGDVHFAFDALAFDRERAVAKRRNERRVIGENAKVA